MKMQMIISKDGRWEAGRIFQVLPSQDKRESSGARTHSNMVCSSSIKAFSNAFDSKFTFQEFITRDSTKSPFMGVFVH